MSKTDFPFYLASITGYQNSHILDENGEPFYETYEGIRSVCNDN